MSSSHSSLDNSKLGDASINDESLGCTALSSVDMDQSTSSSSTPVKTACQVCNEFSPSIRPGSLACEACKKFFMRNYDASKKFQCENGGKCLQAGSAVNRRSCQACRMERCVALGLSDKVRPPKPAIDLRFVPCAVCGASSTGYHFGILSCEGCKGFFRRTVKYDLAKNFSCDTGGKCVIDPLRQKCKKCRFERCLSSGMSPTGSHIGRHTNAQRAETKREIERLQNEQKLLKAPIMVRQLKRGAAAAALLGTGSSNLPCNANSLSSAMDVKVELVSPSATVDDGNVPSFKRRSRSRQSSGGSNLPTPQQTGPSSVQNQQSPLDPILSSVLTPLAHDFETMAEIFARGVDASTQRYTIDEATMAAAQSLMSIFGGSPAADVASPMTSSNYDASLNSPVFQPPQNSTSIAGRSEQAPSQQESSIANMSGISSFLARLNAHAPTTMAASANIPSSGGPMFAPDYKAFGINLEENSRTSILQRIRMPVAPSNFIWLHNSGSDWTSISQLLNSARQTMSSSFMPPSQLYNQPLPSMPAQHQMQPRPLLDTFSLNTFIRMLDSDQLLPEPAMDVYTRSEYLLAQVTNSVRNLAHIKNLRIFFDPGWTAEECWKQGMVCFENHTRYVLAFVRSLPGYSALDATDRTTLFTNALFPLTVAQLSLDYDMEEREENFLSMDHVGRELMSLHFPPMRQLRRHVVDAGVGIKTSKLNVVEFGLIAAIVFFNSDLPNLVDAEKVRQISEELRTAATIFVGKTCSADASMASPSHRHPVDERMQLINSHISYLTSLHQTHTSLMGDFARQFPHLINTNPLHLEMYINQPGPLLPPPPPPSSSPPTS